MEKELLIDSITKRLVELAGCEFIATDKFVKFVKHKREQVEETLRVIDASGYDIISPRGKKL